MRAFMSALVELIQTEAAGSSIAFRERLYRRADQGELLRDVIALANAAVIGERFLFIGVEDKPGRGRRLRGISERGWKNFCAALLPFLERALEPRLGVTLEAVRIGEVLVGAVCLAACEDPPYLLARRVDTNMPAGGGWIRRGTRQARLLRRHLQRIFEARFRRQDLGEISVGFPGRLPREELQLSVMSLDSLPSALAAHRIERMIEGKRVSKSVLGRSDTRMARLVHAQVSNQEELYCSRGTSTLRRLLVDVPGQQVDADDHYRYELRAHRVNLLLSNVSDREHSDMVLTVKFPRVAGLELPERRYYAPGEKHIRQGLYPQVDAGPRTVSVQVMGLRIPARGSSEAFLEPLRLCLREGARGQSIRVAYTLQGPTLERPVRGRLKILVEG